MPEVNKAVREDIIRVLKNAAFPLNSKHIFEGCQVSTQGEVALELKCMVSEKMLSKDSNKAYVYLGVTQSVAIQPRKAVAVIPASITEKLNQLEGKFKPVVLDDVHSFEVKKAVLETLGRILDDEISDVLVSISNDIETLKKVAQI